VDTDQDEDEVRDILRAVLKLFWIQALGHIANIEKEVEILKSAPPTGKATRPLDPPSSKDETWRVDMPTGGPLLDKSGRVGLSSFTVAWSCIDSMSAITSYHHFAVRCRR